ncbi:hypothetical protein PanWU01x14_348260 [Parasponia andersonii]|uniref:Uncharacterized protein n=1 Tax=Parasponia andersonii TaxID=3476 RepID=A0A2P5ABR8_PARAD|nr:hypothetical protein PanWU01x14_348260 [Parasponia andersonii]
MNRDQLEELRVKPLVGIFSLKKDAGASSQHEALVRASLGIVSGVILRHQVGCHLAETKNKVSDGSWVLTAFKEPFWATHSQSLSRHSQQSPVVVSLGQNLVDALRQHSTLKVCSPLSQHLPPRLSRAQLRCPLSFGLSSSSVALSPQCCPSFIALSLGRTQALSPLGSRLQAPRQYLFKLNLRFGF